MNLKTTVCSFLAVLFLISCDNETSGLGKSLVPEGDVMIVTADSCFASSRTILSPDSLLISGSGNILGQFTESGSNTTIHADFITQLSCMEGFEIPDSVYGIGNHTFPEEFIKQIGNQKPFYANLRLYYSSFFGDSTNTVNIDIYTLDRMVDVKRKYYPDTDPSLFCDTDKEPYASITVSAWNLQNSDSIRDKSSYYPSIAIPLPDSVAQFILESYYDPERKHYFSGSIAFMENVFKGFYIRCSQGDGTMFYIDHAVLEVNFKSLAYDDDDAPYVESLMAEFPGNSEVVQIQTINWTGLESQVADNSCTWIRSPFGVLTEITLPIDSMRDEVHVLNSAQLLLSSAVTPSNRFKPSIPTYLLLIRKDQLQGFFKRNNVADNVESFVTGYSTKFGTYTFSNIAAMVEKIYSEREDWKEANNGDNDAFEAANPSWNKVVLIPITPVLDSRGTALSYRLDLKLHQVKLIGGSTPIKIKTIRSKF